MKKRFLVIGLGRFGMSIVRTLSSLNAEIVAIDIDESMVEGASKYVEYCAICDSTRLKALEELGARNFDHAVVAIGNNLQASILTIINLKELGIKKISVRADNEEYAKVMERLGADEVIVPEEEAAVSFANQIISDTILEYHPITKDYSIVKVIVNTDFSDETIASLDIRNRFNINIVGILRGKNFIQAKASDSINKGDVLTIFGASSNISKFDRFLNQ